MIGWTQINPTLIEVFTEVAIDPDLESDNFSAGWREGRRGIIHDKQNVAVYLKVTTVTGIGEDETRYELVPSDSQAPADQPYLGRYRTITYGHRRVNLQVEANVPEHTDVFWAMATLERIRTALSRPSVIAKLIAGGIVITSVLDSRKTTYKDHGRMVSAGLMDVRFTCVATSVDPVPVGWIEAIKLTSRLALGNELPAPPNVTDDLVPTGWQPPNP